MTERFIDLTDGTRIEMKVNFGTLYYLQKCKGFYGLVKRLDKKKEKGQDPSPEEAFDISADIVYALLRSNGRAVTFDEALALVPPDIDDLSKILEDYQAEYDRYSKKKQAKTLTMPDRQK